MENQRNCLEDISAVDTLIACEHETWNLIQRKDLNGFARYLAEDFYDIFPDGQERTKSELLEFLRGADLQDYRLNNFPRHADSRRCDHHISRRRAVIDGKMNIFIRLGQARRHVVERVRCGFGAPSATFKITGLSRAARLFPTPFAMRKDSQAHFPVWRPLFSLGPLVRDA